MTVLINRNIELIMNNINNYVCKDFSSWLVRICYCRYCYLGLLLVTDWVIISFLFVLDDSFVRCNGYILSRNDHPSIENTQVSL